MTRTIARFPLELIVWTAGLTYLALADPHGHVPQFCLSKLVGLGACPGCGLGASVSHLLHGELMESWKSHWMGGPALIGLLLRIGQLAIWEVRAFRGTHRYERYSNHIKTPV